MDTGYVVVDANSDVIVAGAGIIGLSVALEMAEAGLRVTVIERSTSMSEASSAAAGMLAVGDPENPFTLKELAEFSLSLYPGYLRRIEALSGCEIPLRTRVTLQGSRRGQPFQPAYRSGRAISATEARKLAPHLNASNREFRVIDELSLDPRNLCAALPAAVRTAGVAVSEQTSVLSVSSLSGQGVEITTSRGRMLAKAYVNCAGAWAGGITYSCGDVASPESDIASLPIIPRKGQIVMVALNPRESPQCVIRTPEVYLVPRGDGRVLIGATVEDAGYSKRVEPEVISSLIARAAILWPPIASSTVIESWAGLRPGSPDGLPIIGPLYDSNCSGSGRSRQWVAAGHFRNGILLAPATGRLISQLVRGAPTEIDISHFGSSRFAAALAK